MGRWTRMRAGGGDVLLAGAAFVLGAALVARWPVPLRREGQEPGSRPAVPLAAALHDGRGRFADSPAELPARAWRDVFWRVYAGFTDDRVMAVAGGVTFYTMLALFPALAAFISLFGLYAEPVAVIRELDQWRGVLPGAAVEIISDQIERIVTGSNRTLGFAFALSLVVALWSANAGMKALFDALNIVYGESEKRSFIRLNAVSLLFTSGALALMLLAMGAVVVLPLALAMLPGLPGELLIRWGRWPLLFVAVSIGLALIYRYAPSRERPRWQWLSVGSVFAASAWLASSMLFSWYAANLTDYNETYGSLGAIMAFMIWVWISVIVVLVGAQINAEAEHQTARDSTTGAPLPLGLRGATMADTVGESPA